MNKRLKKKMAKKSIANIPTGHGVITGNDNSSDTYIRHAYLTGTIVRVLGFGGISIKYANCIDENGLEQSVSLEHIKMNLAEVK